VGLGAGEGQNRRATPPLTALKIHPTLSLVVREANRAVSRGDDDDVCKQGGIIFSFMAFLN